MVPLVPRRVLTNSPTRCLCRRVSDINHSLRCTRFGYVPMEPKFPPKPKPAPDSVPQQSQHKWRNQQQLQPYPPPYPPTNPPPFPPKTTLFSWGTFEDLLLACAVNRHGTTAWDSVSNELNHRHTTSVFTSSLCHGKYLDLKRRFSTVDGGDNGGGDDMADNPPKFPGHSNLNSRNLMFDWDL